MTEWRYIDPAAVERWLSAFALWRNGAAPAPEALARWTRAVASSFETIAGGEAAAGHEDTAYWPDDQFRMCAELMEARFLRPGGFEEGISEREANLFSYAFAVGAWNDPHAASQMLFDDGAIASGN
jgi:hypothetical protein